MNRDQGLGSQHAGTTEPGTDADFGGPPEHRHTLSSTTTTPASPDHRELPEPEGEIPSLMNLTLGLDTKLIQLSELFQNRLSYDKAKEEAFDRLYSELEQLKSNAAFEQLRPLYLDLILLFDRIENICQSVRSVAQQDPNILPLFSSLSEELTEILYRREIEVIQSVSLAFDASTQRAIGVEPTLAEGETGHIARVVRRGFRYRNRVIRAEEVIVKKFAPATGT